MLYNGSISRFEIVWRFYFLDLLAFAKHENMLEHLIILFNLLIVLSGLGFWRTDNECFCCTWDRKRSRWTDDRHRVLVVVRRTHRGLRTTATFHSLVLLFTECIADNLYRVVILNRFFLGTRKLFIYSKFQREDFT